MAVARGSTGVARARLFGVGVTHSRTKRQAPGAPKTSWWSARVLSEPVEETLPYRMRVGPLSDDELGGIVPNGSRCDGLLGVVSCRGQLMSSGACGEATLSTRELWKAAVNADGDDDGDDDSSSCCICVWACWWSMFGRTKFGCFLVVTSASAASCD